MFHLKPTGCVSLAFLLLSVLFGCSPAREEDGRAGEESTEGPFVLGDLVKPFDPPTREELEKKVKENGGWDTSYMKS